MPRKYVVRDGFVVVLMLTKTDGSTYERVYEGGEQVDLDDDAVALHKHKLEFASQKERDAAFAAEKQAKVDAAANQSPVDLVSMLTHALSQAMANAQPAQAPAA